jgi:uncharacterized protein YqgC (DUF456 family)
LNSYHGRDWETLFQDRFDSIDHGCQIASATGCAAARSATTAALVGFLFGPFGLGLGLFFGKTI